MKKGITIRELESYKLVYDFETKCFYVNQYGEVVFNAGMDSQLAIIWMIKEFMWAKDLVLKESKFYINQAISYKHKNTNQPLFLAAEKKSTTL